jgi:hypothetical protein
MDRQMQMSRAPGPSSAILFAAIGILLYLGLLGGAEWLAWRTGHMNPIFKVERARSDYDWVILGASHAMPLAYDDFNAQVEAATGQRVLNLAGPGTGPLYNRFVLEQFLSRRRTREVLYVVDAFAFRSPQWNEQRLADHGLLARTPLRLSVARRLADYVRQQRVDPRALVNYVTGFSKLNNADRFARDVFEGEAQFDRVFRPSITADARRIDYLYPAVENESAQFDRYFDVLAGLVGAARAANARVVLAKFPVPERFGALLPDESQFDARLRAFAEAQRLALHDFSAAVQGREFYADTDHLNRAGVQVLLERHLRALLARAPASGEGVAAGARSLIAIKASPRGW